MGYPELKYLATLFYFQTIEVISALDIGKANGILCNSETVLSVFRAGTGNCSSRNADANHKNIVDRVKKINLYYYFSNSINQIQ